MSATVTVCHMDVNAAFKYMFIQEETSGIADTVLANKIITQGSTTVSHALPKLSTCQVSAVSQ